jgi:hypothetical protein
MTPATHATQALPGPAGDTYEAGACNIGPAEIARRRRAGHVGTMLTIGVVALLIAIDAPPVTRLVAIIPAAVAASGYLQARLRFCAAYGERGVFNLGEQAGETEAVVNEEDRARDRRRARQIGLASFAIGTMVGLVAVLLPI